jgi:hypothetical protein
MSLAVLARTDDKDVLNVEKLLNKRRNYFTSTLNMLTYLLKLYFVFLGNFFLFKFYNWSHKFQVIEFRDEREYEETIRDA